MPVLLLIILLVISGFVAAAGDRMGHRAARAKIRFGKMRPRNVSTLIAIASGVLITLVTYTAVFFIYKDFREALTRYDDTKSRLNQVQAELDTYDERLSTAESRLTEAGQAKLEAEAEASAAREQTIQLTADLGTIQQSLDDAEQELESKETQVAGLNSDIAARRREIASLENVEAGLRTQIQDMRRSFQEGEVVVPRDWALAYVRIKPGNASNLKPLLHKALEDARVRLPENNDYVDNIDELIDGFVASYPYAGSSTDVAVVVTSAQNVFEGGDVVPDFLAVPLNTLISSGDVVMEVSVGVTEAKVRWLNRTMPGIEIPSQLDADSLLNLFLSLEEILQVQATELGFLPDIFTGIVPSPVESLAGVADELLTRKRPFTIVFVAKEPLDALDGLTAMDIYLPPSNSGQPEAETTPAPVPEGDG